MVRRSRRRLHIALGPMVVITLIGTGVAAWGQSPDALGYSVATPRPISPAEGTTNPSAQATQSQNPYLGSVPSENTGTRIELTLKNAIERGLRFNLGLIESRQVSANVRAERLRALSVLLPQVSADGQARRKGACGALRTQRRER